MSLFIFLLDTNNLCNYQIIHSHPIITIDYYKDYVYLETANKII